MFERADSTSALKHPGLWGTISTQHRMHNGKQLPLAKAWCPMSFGP